MTVQLQLRFRKARIFKALICIVLLFTFLLYRFLFPQPNPDCIFDAYHSWTEGINRNFVTDSGSAFEGNSNQLTITGKGVIGTGQLLMDIWIGIIGVLWLISIKNVRAFGAIGAFYLIRGTIFLNLQKFPYPNDMAWRSPGFFSFTVPYDHTRDFFFSGHTGGLSIVFIQMVTLRLTVPSILAGLSLLYMMNMLLVTKVHYTIDILGALAFAFWFHRMASRYVAYIDKFLSLPHWIYKKLKLKYCPLIQEIQVPSVKADSAAKLDERKKSQSQNNLAVNQLVQDQPDQASNKSQDES